MVKLVLLGVLGYFDNVKDDKCMKASLKVAFGWVLLFIFSHNVSGS